MKNWLGLLLTLIVVSCTEQRTNRPESVSWNPIPLAYAQGFSLEKSDNLIRVTIHQPFKEANDQMVYIFYPKASRKPNIAADAHIATPVKSIVCTSTTHIPLLDYLDETQALVGFPTTDYISSKAMRERVNSGKVSELGIDDALNLEKLLELKPELVMGYTLTGDLGQYEIIQQAGIPVVLNAEYLEQHPLGRAEWVKLAGVIFNKLEHADSVFRKIEEDYLDTQKLVEVAGQHPSAISGVLYGDSWYLPGGNNYASKMLRDAGFDFFWANDTTSAFLPMSFESVFDKGSKADYWIGVASYGTLEEVASADQRYTNFAAYRKGNVYSYNKLMGEKGGSQFLELGYLRPDLILKDLVKIAHPELLPEHELFFHFKLP